MTAQIHDFSQEFDMKNFVDLARPRLSQQIELAIVFFYPVCCTRMLRYYNSQVKFF